MTKSQERLEELRSMRHKIEEMFQSTSLAPLAEDWNFLFEVLELQEETLRTIGAGAGYPSNNKSLYTTLKRGDMMRLARKTVEEFNDE